MPRMYEVVYIFDSALEDTAVTERLGRYHQMLGVGDDVTVDHWGRRQLAYPIGQRENGYYVVARYNAEPATLPEFERALRLDDSVVRYLIALHEHELGAPPMSEEELAAARKREEEEEDED
jgi:small subunit ribosomal protein S6